MCITLQGINTLPSHTTITESNLSVANSWAELEVDENVKSEIVTKIKRNNL